MNDGFKYGWPEHKSNGLHILRGCLFRLFFLCAITTVSAPVSSAFSASDQKKSYI